MILLPEDTPAADDGSSVIIRIFTVILHGQFPPQVGCLMVQLVCQSCSHCYQPTICLTCWAVAATVPSCPEMLGAAHEHLLAAQRVALQLSNVADVIQVTSM